MGWLTDARHELAEVLAGDELTSTPEPGAQGALPSLTIEPGDPWLEAEGTPGKIVTLGFTATIAAAYKDPKSATPGLEDVLSEVLDRLPSSWRLVSIDAPTIPEDASMKFLAARVRVTRAYRLT